MTHPSPADLSCTCTDESADASAATIPDPASVHVAVGPARFVACGARGTHARVSDCWVCWSDVHLGECDLVDVLHPDHVDLLTLLEAPLTAPPERPALHVACRTDSDC